MSNSKYVSSFRRRRKQNLVDVAGGSCVLCGYNKCIRALEFHHLDSEKKEFGLSSGNCRDLQKDVEELKKCILVCSNCHCEIHSGLYSKDFLQSKQIINEEVIENLFSDKNKLFEKTVYYCNSCGVEIEHEGKCLNCYKKSQAKNIPPREELKKLIQEYNFVSIGKKFGITDNAVRKWCKKYNLPFRSCDIKNYSDEDWNNI